MKKIEINKNKEVNQIQSKYEIFENFIFENYTLEINDVTNQEIITRKKDNKNLNIYDLIRDCKLNNIKASKQMISDLFKMSNIAIYSPYKAYFETLPKFDNKQKSEIEKLNKLLTPYDFKDGVNYLDRNLEILKKWLVSSVAQIFDDYSNDVMLIFVSRNKQGIGKTQLVRKFIEQLNFIKTGQSLLKNLENLPEAATKYPFIFYDELKGLKRNNDLELFKTTITDVRIEFMKWQKIFIKKRVSSFIGTADSSQLLFDTSGSRRFAILELSNIDYKEYNKSIDFSKIWAEAYFLFNNNFENFKFNSSDFAAFEKFNIRYYQSSSIKFWIDKFYSPGTPADENKFKCTSTQLLQRLVANGLPQNVYQDTTPEKIGIALKQLNFSGKREKTNTTGNVDKYYVIKERK